MKQPPDSPSGAATRPSRVEDVLVFQLDERDIELLQEEEAEEDSFARRFALEREGHDVWRQNERIDDAQAPNLFERINQMQSVLVILRACLPDAKNLLSIENELVRVAEQTTSRDVLSGDFAKYDPHTQAIMAQVAHIEETLIAAESKIPISWLRHRTDEQDFGDIALAHYVRFQMQHLKIAPRSFSRIDLLVSRLAARRDARGVLHIRPPGEVAELLNACVPRSDTPAHVRSAAAQFFNNAKQRLDEFNDADEIFESGFYVDVLGYKLSLRYDYFDPRLLYASAELTIAIENWLVHTHGVSLRVLDPQFAQAREKVRKIFSRASGDVSTLTAQWNREFSSPGIRTPGRRAAPKLGRPAKSSGMPSWRKLVAIAVVIIAAIYIAPTAMEFLRTNQRGLKSISDSETAAISPLLMDGAWAGEPPNRLFIGHVDPGQWSLRKNKERRDEVDTISEELGLRDVRAALIYMALGQDEVLVINIMEGEIRYIQPYSE